MPRRAIANVASIAAVVAALAVVVALAACGPATGTVKVGQNDSGKPITLTVGQKLEVALPGNPSTGYNWHVKSADQSILEPATSQPAFTQGGAPGAVGAGGIVTWTFVANSAGATKVELEYKRAWETTVPPAATWSAPVAVK